ncbi:MAG: pyridoxal-phosphate dependent enzyme [Bacteroidota bacterium]
MAYRYLLPSPLQPLRIKRLSEAGVHIDIKRDDMIHPWISGNKWRKLKYNFNYLRDHNYGGVITWGGAFSNHLIAVAAMAKSLNVPSVGLIRGYALDAHNPTIRRLEELDMQLYPVEPKEYQLKTRSAEAQNILERYSDYFLIPEGGTNAHAIRGVSEIWDEIDGQYDAVYVGLGTGGTAAGLTHGHVKAKQIIVVSSFRGEVDSLAGLPHMKKDTEVEIVPSAIITRFGAYHAEIASYIRNVFDETGLYLDPIYTSKVMMTMEQHVQTGKYPVGSRILFLHTGGLQGINGYNYLHLHRMNEPLPIPSSLIQ